MLCFLGWVVVEYLTVQSNWTDPVCWTILNPTWNKQKFLCDRTSSSDSTYCTCKIVLLQGVLIIGLLFCWDSWMKGLEGITLFPSDTVPMLCFCQRFNVVYRISHLFLSYVPSFQWWWSSTLTLSTVVSPPLESFWGIRSSFSTLVVWNCSSTLHPRWGCCREHYVEHRVPYIHVPGPSTNDIANIHEPNCTTLN